MIDTREKRASILGLALPFIMHLPVPAGVIAQPEQQHLAHLYAGISATPPPAPGVAIASTNVTLMLGVFR